MYGITDSVKECTGFKLNMNDFYTGLNYVDSYGWDDVDHYPRRKIAYKAFIELPHEKLNVGDIAYWVEEPNRNGIPNWHISVGVIDDVYSDCYIANYIESTKKLVVTGLSDKPLEFTSQEDFHEYFSNLSWRKLPKDFIKNYDYTARLYNWEVVNAFDEHRNFDDVDSLKKGLESGSVIRQKDSVCFWSYPSQKVEIGKWKPVTVSSENRCRNNMSLTKNMVFNNYKDAKTLLDMILDEYKKLSDMSDKDYAKFYMMERLDMACHGTYGAFLTDEEAIKIHKYMLKKKNFGEIETRLYEHSFQWRYFDEKKWHTVNPNTLY